MLASCHASNGVLFSAGLCLLVAINVMFVHSQNSKCESSGISIAISIIGKLNFRVSMCNLVMHRGFCTLVV